MLKRKSLMLAKIEGTYGVDPTPAPATDAILVSNPQVKIDGERKVREFDSPTLGFRGHVIGVKKAQVTFSTELKGSGTANAGGATDVPEIDPLLQACGFALTLTAESGGGVGDGDCTYDPVSTGQKSVTLYVYKDGILHKITGAVGNFSIDLKAGEFGVINWEFEGLYVAPIDGAIAAGAVYDATAPDPWLAAAMTIGIYSPVIEGMTIDLGNSMATRRDANSASGIAGIAIANRETVGSMNPEAVTKATYDFWANWAASTGQALSTTVGATAGNKIDITAPKVMLNEMNWGDRDEVRVYDIPISFAQSSGDDEIKLKFY